MLYIIPIFVLIFASLVILQTNPVKATLSLIGTFFCTTLLVFLLGLEFYGLIYIIIYVGAVSVLFLFVVMTLNLKNTTLYIPSSYHQLFSFLTIVLFFGSLLWSIFFEIPQIPLFTTGLGWAKSFFEVSTLKTVASVLYTDYFIGVILAGLILFVGMIGGILLTHDANISQIRHQDLYTQLQRTPQRAIFLISKK